MKAFPQNEATIHIDLPLENQQGMDLRDYFAAKALMATIETSHTYFEVGDTLEQDVLTVAQMAYMYADAMMEARK
jgi:hypothetical protein